MSRLIPIVSLASLVFALAGCTGEQTAPKPDPAQFAPKAGGPADGPNAAPKTP